MKFCEYSSFPWELNDAAQIRDFVRSLPEGKLYSSASSAIEMSLLDAIGKREKKSIIEYFPHDYYSDTVQYGATITLGDNERVVELCNLISDLNIKTLRIKMGKNLEQDKRAFEIVRSIIGEDCDIRIDPNRIWDRDLAISHLSLVKEYNVKVVEEPMPSDGLGFEELVDMIRSAGAILMACESAPTFKEVEDIVKKKHYQLINVKVGRSGGFSRIFKIINFLRENGVAFQIGCSLGESGILSAAGRAVCLLCNDAVYYDGSYDKLLLKENTTVKDVSFGKGGIAGPLDGPGLGIEVSLENLKKYSSVEPITIRSPNV
jgi:muconate cycloisomerase